MNKIWVTLAMICAGLIVYGVKILQKWRFQAYCHRIGQEGEDSVYTRLKAILPAKSRIVRNAYLPTQAGQTEVDLIAITPKKIFIIEVKNYKGKIYGKEKAHSWYKYPGDGQSFVFYNPVMQNAGHIRAFKQLFPEIPSQKICSYIVFGKRCTDVHARVRRKTARVIRLNQMESKIRRELLFRRRFLSKAQINQMIERIEDTMYSM